MIRKIINRIQRYSHKETVDLQKSQWWSLEKLQSFQNKRLRKIIRYAYNHIPGYKQKFDKVNIKPGHIKTMHDLYKIPITTREELQNNNDFINKEKSHWTLYTGGSTGNSLEYYLCKDGASILRNVHLRGWSWNGYEPGKKIAVIASVQGTVKQPNVLNLFGDLTTENLKKNVDELLRFKPEYLRGYVGSLYILAKYCLDNKIKLKGIKSVDPISENLYDYQREVMEIAFGEVFEEYCCNDGGACAWECDKHEGLHYFMERSIIEEVDGNMIVTDLWNKAMPFIRYSNGDKVKFLNSECECGRKLPLIKVKGRDNDIIITPKGPVSPTYLLGIGYGKIYSSAGQLNSGISTMQYIQRENYYIDVNVVKNDNFSEDNFSVIVNGLNEVLSGMKIKINFVDDIPKTKKGKRQFIINEDKELLNRFKNHKENS